MMLWIGPAVLGVVLVACASRTLHAPVAAAAIAAQAGGAAAPATTPASPTDEPEAAGAADTDEEVWGHVEQNEIVGQGGVRVLVRWRTMTGTRHLATEIEITAPGGVLRRSEPELDDVDSMPDPGDYPLLERILTAGPGRWVVLGWSSYGEGMQTVHAWLIEDRGGPRLVDTLAWTTDRSHNGLALDAAGGRVQIGIPLPERPSSQRSDESDDRDHIHVPGDWQLVHGAQRFDLDRVEQLPALDTHVMALRSYYTPPFQDEPSRLHWRGRFVWFAAGQKFALVRAPRQ
jgi:hypothetical protein